MILVMVVLLGLCFGSFVNALVWRLKKKRNFVSERSECTHCHHILAWYDLVPVLSWVLLRGRCRYCHKPIDDSPITEVSVSVVFGFSYFFWPFGFSTTGLILLALWLIAVVLLAALFLYDFRWMLLPNKLVFPLIGIGVLWAAVYRFGYLTFPAALTSIFVEVILGLASVAGLYGLLYLISRGAWVGFGDVKLGIFMGLILSWQQGLLAVVLANVIAFLVVLPGLLSGKIKRNARVPFGPFLIVATVIAFLFGQQILTWYFVSTLSLVP